MHTYRAFPKPHNFFTSYEMKAELSLQICNFGSAKRPKNEWWSSVNNFGPLQAKRERE